jgi:hypothetical protein
MRIARGDSVMSFQTILYKRVFSSGVRFSKAKTLLLIHERRKADFPKVTIIGFKRLLMPEKSLPSAIAAFARLDKDNLGEGVSAWTSGVFKGSTPFGDTESGYGSNYNILLN